MFKGKEVENAIRKVYSYLYPNKKERKEALARLDMEKLVQSIRYRSETPLAYYAGGSADLSMKYHGPDLFEHKDGIDIARDFLRRSHVLVVCGDTVNEAMKNDIAVAERLRITATTLDGLLTVKGQGREKGGSYEGN